MIVKPALQWLNKSSDPVLINTTGIILTKMAENVAVYPVPSPTLATVQTALNDFSAGVSATGDGGPPTTAIKNDRRRALVVLLRQLAAYVGVACQGDMVNLLLSGFPTHKAVRQRIGVLAAPDNVMLTWGVREGDLVGRTNPVPGAVMYNWRLQANTPGAEPIESHSTAANYSFTGLTPGVIYTLDVNVKGTAGASDWSNPVSVMAV